MAVKVDTKKGLTIGKDGVAINDGFGLITSSDGRLNIYTKEDGGIDRGPGGISVTAGYGIAFDNNGVNVRLAKGAKTKSGEGHGANGTTSGGAGGLFLDANGLSVDAGDGMQTNSHGVSIKLASNSGLRADESDGLSLRLEQNKGLQISEAGVRAGVGKGMRISDTGMIEPAIGSYCFSDNKNGTEYSPLVVNTGTNE